MAPPTDLYVSPHLDDVVLSCGGRLAGDARERRTAVVATVFAASGPPDPPSPVATAYETAMGIDVDSSIRQREDREALALLGARPIHLTYLDCIYRLRTDGTPLVTREEDIFECDPTEDAELLEQVAAEVANVASTVEVGRLVLPLAVGWHRDHVLVRRAGEKAASLLPDAVDVTYFEDLPYSAAEPDSVADAAAGMSSDLLPLPALDFDARTAAISRYGSQLQILWHERDGLLPAIREYACSLGGGCPAERYWRATVR